MEKLTFKSAFKYPFKRATGMWNILWVFLPIIGWFALGGYSIKIAQEFCNGKFEQLPTFDFGDNLKLGFSMFFKAIPFLIIYMIIIVIAEKMGAGVSAAISFVIGFFMLPILFMNFFNKQTVASLFEIKITNSVYSNLGDYIMVMLKSLGLGIVFLLMCVVLIGIPAGSFSKNMFLADFYRRNVK